MKSIRSLSLGKLTSTQLSSEDFTDFGVELEDLKLTRSSINSIKSHAFKNVRGIRRLDLSENDISSIDNEAFTEVIYPIDCKQKTIRSHVNKIGLLSDWALVNFIKSVTRICQLIHHISSAIISNVNFIRTARFD